MDPLVSLGDIDTGFFALNLSGMAVLGAVTGYAAKKVAKLVALLVGAQTAFLALLERQGLISVDWTRLSSAVEKTTSPESFDFVNTLVSTGTLGAGFAGGFALGFKRA